jgi:hypothetical protein
MDMPADYLELSRLIKSNTDPLHEEIERLRAAFLHYIQVENGCFGGNQCRYPEKCSCLLEFQALTAAQGTTDGI